MQLYFGNKFKFDKLVKQKQKRKEKLPSFIAYFFSNPRHPFLYGLLYILLNWRKKKENWIRYDRVDGWTCSENEAFKIRKKKF